MSDRLILPPPASDAGAESLARSARLSELAERETTLSSIDQQFEALSKLTRLSDKLEGQWQGVRAERAAIETERQSLRAEQAAVDGAQQDQGSGAGTTGHVGNHSAQWKALVIAPDLCKVGKSVVAFNSFACLDRPINRSPNVLGDGLHLYRVGDLFKGIEADAGRHIVSGTSQGRGYVKILTGKDSVKTNGLPTAWQGSRCLVNCNAQGIGGAPGQIVTETKTVERSMARRMGDESAKVIEEAWSGLKGTAKTLWDALPGTADEAATAAARERIGEGIVGTAEGLGTLAGPPPEMIQGAYLSGNAEAIALIEQMQANQRQAIGAIADNIGQAWREADARSGTAGAVAMVATTIGTEVVGGKGLGALAKTGARIGHIVKMAKTPLEAATKLDAEIKAARAAGRSAEEIKLLEEAREAQLKQAREAANAKAGKAGEGNEGGDGVHVKRRRLAPNSTYELNGYKYTTDAEGRIKTVEGQLRPGNADRNPYAQRTVGAGDGRLPDDQGGHLIGAQFDGYGGPENLTPMHKDINAYHTGEWGRMEKGWAEHLKSGDTVHVKIELNYTDDTMRASSFDVTETINGKESFKIIDNPR